MARTCWVAHHIEKMIDPKEIEEHISIFIIHCNTVKQNIEGTEREVVEFEFELLNPGK